MRECKQRAEDEKCQHATAHPEETRKRMTKNKLANCN